MKKVELTEIEWMNLIDQNRELGTCCATIAYLRDSIIQIARNGGETTRDDVEEIIGGYEACQEGHDMVTGKPTLVKLIEQVRGMEAEGPPPGYS